MLEFVFHGVEMRTAAFYSLAKVVADKIEYNAKVSAGVPPMKDRSSFMSSFSETLPVIFPCKWSPDQSSPFF